MSCDTLQIANSSSGKNSKYRNITIKRKETQNCLNSKRFSIFKNNAKQIKKRKKIFKNQDHVDKSYTMSYNIEDHLNYLSLMWT